jgi:hypothetical protein
VLIEYIVTLQDQDKEQLSLRRKADTFTAALCGASVPSRQGP